MAENSPNTQQDAQTQKTSKKKKTLWRRVKSACKRGWDAMTKSSERCDVEARQPPETAQTPQLPFETGPLSLQLGYGTPETTVEINLSNLINSWHLHESSALQSKRTRQGDTEDDSDAQPSRKRLKEEVGPSLRTSSASNAIIGASGRRNRPVRRNRPNPNINRSPPIAIHIFTSPLTSATFSPNVISHPAPSASEISGIVTGSPIQESGNHYTPADVQHVEGNNHSHQTVYPRFTAAAVFPTETMELNGSDNTVGNMTVTPTVVAASGDLSLMITSTSEDSAYTGAAVEQADRLSSESHTSSTPLLHQIQNSDSSEYRLGDLSNLLYSHTQPQREQSRHNTSSEAPPVHHTMEELK